MKTKILKACFAATLLALPSLHAQTLFDWSFGASSGTLEASPSGGGSYLVSSISGTFDGSPVQSLVSPGAAGFNNDNLIFPAASGSSSLDLNGIGLSTAAETWQVFKQGKIDSAKSFGPAASMTAIFTVTQVPEPSTYALLGLGALALVIAYRRRVA